MLWASRYGKQELFMDEVGKAHFENRESASHTKTLLKVAGLVGLDMQAAEQFLASEELTEFVWASYGSTIHEKGIQSIPLFVFNGPATSGGPFRQGDGDPTVVHGSGSPQEFKSAFEQILQVTHRKLAAM